MRRKSMLITAAAGALLLTGTIAASGIVRADDDHTMVIEQAAPQLHAVKSNQVGEVHGDALMFTAPVTAEDGSTGRLSGVLVTISIDGLGDGTVNERSGHLQFTFPNGTILVAGTTLYPVTETEMEKLAPQPRVVVGGTGEYMGVDGEVVTVRNSDGTYTHTFTFED